MTDVLGLNKESIHGVRPLDWFGDYAIMLDNHSLALRDCKKIVRVGTVFFNLPKLAEMDMLHFLDSEPLSQTAIITINISILTLGTISPSISVASRCEELRLLFLRSYARSI